MFKKALVSALVLAAASVAVPAAAQSHGAPRHGPVVAAPYGGWQTIAQRKYNLDRRIDQGERNRTLSRREAVSLRGQLNALVRMEVSYRRGGLTLRERQDLDRRYDRLSAQVRVDRHDNNGRPGRR